VPKGPIGTDPSVASSIHSSSTLIVLPTHQGHVWFISKQGIRQDRTARHAQPMGGYNNSVCVCAPEHVGLQHPEMGGASQPHAVASESLALDVHNADMLLVQDVGPS
jgi:hypothetical protein